MGLAVDWEIDMVAERGTQQSGRVSWRHWRDVVEVLLVQFGPPGCLHFRGGHQGRTAQMHSFVNK